jgi:DNA-directed RNA polymerase specialized sigma24 family protein
MSQALRSLVDGARAGDRAALKELAGCVDRFLRIFSGALSRGVRRAHGSTADFVLEGLAEALAKLDDFQYTTDQEFYAWAGRFIRHRIIDAGRREGRQKRGVQPAVLGSRAGAVEAGDPTASEVACREEVREVAGRVLLELQIEHPLEMEAVVLKVFDELSWPELRDAMSLTSDKRARTLVARGFDLLKPRLEERLGPDVMREFLGR